MTEDPKNVSEAKRRIDERHEMGGPFVQAVDTTSMAMIVTDCRLPDNPIIFANAAFLRLTGYSEDEVLGHNYAMLYGKGTDPEVDQKVEQALQANGDIALESKLYRKDGRAVWVYHHVGVQYEGDRPSRHFASFWNIDRRVRAEREVKQARARLEQRIQQRTRELARTVEDLRREIDRRLAAEQVLRHALEDKDRLLEQRDFLVREVNHRVKNTMQMASALLSMQIVGSTEAPVATALQAAIGRLDRLAEIHQLLYESAEAAAAVDIGSYLGHLCDWLMVAAKADQSRISIQVQVEDGYWAAEEAIPLALIVNEAVTNALKHAFPQDRPGTITVRLGEVGENIHELAIIDDGIGGRKLARDGSLGMKLIDIFARQLHGSLDVNGANGTAITVRFRHEPLQVAPVLAE